jgi:hypothetical protein
MSSSCFGDTDGQRVLEALQLIDKSLTALQSETAATVECRHTNGTSSATTSPGTADSIDGASDVDRLIIEAEQEAQRSIIDRHLDNMYAVHIPT